MVEEDIGTPRRVGAGVIADDRVEPERRFHRLALEPAVEHRARRFGEEVEYVALLLDAEPCKAAPLPSAVDQRAQPFADIGRNAKREVAEQFSDIFERVIISGQRLGIARAELAELGLRAFEPAAELQIAAIFLRQEIADRPLDHAIAVIGEAHVGDHLGLEQADRITRDRVAEPRREFLGHGGAADDVARLDDAHLEPCAREVKGADEAVVAGADDQRVISFGHYLLQPAAGACSFRASGMMSRIRAQKCLRQTSLSLSGPIEKLLEAMPC